MPKILVVDDDDAIRKLVALVARRQGFEVDLATDGVEALDLITSRSYDVAIVDLMMPRLNGYELVASMKTIPGRPFVVIISAMTDALVAQLDASIVQSIIRKPFDIELLASLMTQLSEAMSARRESEPAAADPLDPVDDSDGAGGTVLPFPDQTAC